MIVIDIIKTKLNIESETACVCVCTVVAGNTAVSDPLKARNLGRAALGMAIAGIIVSVLFVFIAFIVLPYGFNIPVFGLTY